MEKLRMRERGVVMGVALAHLACRPSCLAPGEEKRG
jgi:hypothetical protein